MRNRIREMLLARFTRFLEEPVGHYEHNHSNDLERLHATLKKGDVVLVEGHQRISLLIKFLTHSPWSHAALYVGDELVRNAGPLRELAIEHFGDDAQHLVVEALTDGVVASPLSKYYEHNLRIARPHKLRTEHLGEVVSQAVASIGLRYDLRNVIEHALYLAGIALLPARFRKRALRFGSGSSGEVICTSLLGRLFRQVGFPVLPEIAHRRAPGSPERRKRSLLSVLTRRRAPFAGVYRRRDPTLLVPRDFDISPFFEIVKFNVVAYRGFDYESIEWVDEEDPEFVDALDEVGKPEDA